jgi:hypothetical protein
MECGITFLGDLKRMKKEMDRVWNELFENAPEKKQEEACQSFERFPKFEGPARRSPKSRLNKTIKSF